MIRLSIFFSYLFLLFGKQNVDAQQIPILGFHGVQKEYLTEESFRTLKASGININLSIFETNEQAQRALDCAQAAGVKILLYTYDLVNNTKVTVNRFKNHPALFGYFIHDEPDSSMFDLLQHRIEEIKKYDNTKPCYVNLFPNYANDKQLGAKSYVEYLSDFVRKVDVSFISFDHYPLMNNKIYKDWYQNLELIRNSSILYKKPFWGYANATVYGPYSQPTVEGLKLQMYSNLLYGAKGLQYFSYWTLDDDAWKKDKLGYAMVNCKGVPTKTYEVVKKVNQDIQIFADLFMNGTVKSISHFGGEIPYFTKKLDKPVAGFSSFSATLPAMVSTITNGNRNYICVLNKSITQNNILKVIPNSKFEILNGVTNKALNLNRQNEISVKPGDIIIFANTVN